MTNMNEITQKIEDLRKAMHQLINEKDRLTDPKLVELSQKLDGLLNEYDDLLD
ncbi:aspartyl-phosphate phosphatase Spo0E family protein [Clostridium estertheticum]|uniref:Transposase n=2 Tax=Clostridium estertheticum TaxID=238834 RepID=A0A1J0GJ90_9CLOT|nr:aspartyl-phosphate phosphatase Spo0E family protein [Clostridium estertheticum]APC41000.1 transposase [Clostridium estertheticum subsp. estertheticum]MBU3074066.1 aspartyl-phosphate phosphatase Spo0E family protein [Clostridium estertheticum]MBU3164160.1 aspartyl-phosphate phosphatase Spo0E family protein [Clostridium estertheticum]MBU3170096.1 aspartyl-phosphate phosphatase Spo0E family protein [Clostridium estertheticum]MBU3186114.1 aspartyl-phosphate phosphatase Spo0E family protein [Clo